MSFMMLTGQTPRIMQLMTLRKLTLVVLLLQLCDFYRQRFFLDRRREWGLHWRAMILQYAKWPYLLLALVDVIFNRRVPFVITSKVKSKSRSMLIWPQVLIAALVGGSWLIGMLLGHTMHPSLHAWTVILVGASAALIASELFFDSPPPYDRQLWPEKAEQPAARD